MRRQPPKDQGLTVYQLLVSLVVVATLGALWMAYSNHRAQQQPRSEAGLLRHG